MNKYVVSVESVLEPVQGDSGSNGVSVPKAGNVNQEWPKMWPVVRVDLNDEFVQRRVNMVNGVNAEMKKRVCRVKDKINPVLLDVAEIVIESAQINVSGENGWDVMIQVISVA